MFTRAKPPILIRSAWMSWPLNPVVFEAVPHDQNSFLERIPVAKMLEVERSLLGGDNAVKEVATKFIVVKGTYEFIIAHLKTIEMWEEIVS